MKSQRFGIEIEMTGLTRRSAALIIAKHFDTGFRHERGVYDTYSVCDQDGRKWKIAAMMLSKTPFNRYKKIIARTAKIAATIGRKTC